MIKHHKLPHHFTASGLVLANDHILLVNHKRIGAWVPPGGHIELDEMPNETVVREIQEETGIAVAIVSDPVPPSVDADAFFLPRPLYVQSVLAIEKGQHFYHVDMCYLCQPVGIAAGDCLPTPVSSSEVKEARWILLGEVDQLPLAKNVQEALDWMNHR